MTLKEQTRAAAENSSHDAGLTLRTDQSLAYVSGYLAGATASPLLHRALEAIESTQSLLQKNGYLTNSSSVGETARELWNINSKVLAEIKETLK